MPNRSIPRGRFLLKPLGGSSVAEAARGICPLALLVLLLLPCSGLSAEKVDFSRQVQPVLARKCFACHGPDSATREADLRLDQREAALEHNAIVPGKPDQSELLRRIFSDDPDELMPPADSGQTLSDEEKATLRRWIAEGAEYRAHWAFVPPQKPPLPQTFRSSWCRTPIDAFILNRMQAAGLKPSPEADRFTLIRRLSLDLRGLTPSLEEVDAFLKDTRPDAYERLVDRFLASPHYGEKWARHWLDLARYSDTNGYEKDRQRSIWPYRDYVISALNADLPFDQFTIEQLAGDMLPGATERQRIATGFHRNSMINEEGGIDPLEYRFYAMVDRVATTGTVWLGLSTGCAQCHSHKYDPISQNDYYRLMALLNNADEPDLIVSQSEATRKRQQMEQQIARQMAKLAEQFPPDNGPGTLEQRRQRHLEEALADWVDSQRAELANWRVITPTALSSNLPLLTVEDDGAIFSSGDITKRDIHELTFSLDEIGHPITALRIEVLPDDRLPGRGPGRAYYEGRKGDFFLSEVTAETDDGPIAFVSGSHSYGKISIGSGTADAANVFDGDGDTGWSTAQGEGQAHRLVLNFSRPLSPQGELKLTLLFQRHFAASLGKYRIWVAQSENAISASPLDSSIQHILLQTPDTWSQQDRQTVQKEFLSRTPLLAEARKPIEALKKQMPAPVTTMVFLERPPENPRPTHRHHRGEYLSPKELVSPGVPAVFPPIPSSETPNRLSLARWLVSERNPLVARVTVNRAWRAFFGTGLVPTDGDYGTQSAQPTHPDLIDWMAVELVEREWSLKQLHRLIVTSAVYRQQSRGSSASWREDPANIWLSRGPRFRLQGEVFRDALLSASGLLAEKIGGASVYPPQPAAVTELAYGNVKWTPSPGQDRYRRSLYTFSKRTAPFAAYAVFDSPSGENCVARRSRSNTPLQALTVLNDEMFLEFARALAVTSCSGTAQDPSAIAVAMFRRLLTRPPSEQELQAILQFREKQLARLRSQEIDPRQIAGQKDAEAELAAWVMVARALMNLDEAVTKP